jgi:hypothetical protein
MQTTNLSVVYITGANRFDVTASVRAQTLPMKNVSLQFAGLNCLVTFDSSLGTVPTWIVNVQLQFTFDPTNGNLHITPANSNVTGVQSGDWQLGGDFLCAFSGGVFTSSGLQSLFQNTLFTYWESVGLPLCEKPAPTLVGQCPDEFGAK